MEGIPYRKIREDDRKIIGKDLAKNIPKGIFSLIVGIGLLGLIILLLFALRYQIPLIYGIGIVVVVGIFPVVYIFSGINMLKPAKQICFGKIIGSRKDSDNEGQETCYLTIQFENGCQIERIVDYGAYVRAASNTYAAVLQIGKNSDRVLVVSGDWSGAMH